MKEFFSIEGPFMQFFGKLWDIILLSVVFCVCSIPIITFGMNCIALYYTVVKVVLPGERHAVRTFLKMVPRNARQGLPLGILFEIIIAVLTYSLIVILHNDMGALGVFFGVVFVMLFMIVLVVMAYAFPMSARFENTIGEIVANSAFYFKSLYGLGFSRGNDHVINSALNYGYAIVRGLIARSIVCYGLEPSIGVFHHSELNNFNLADDMIEPFRPLVDLYVSQNYDVAEIDSDLTPERKRDIFGIINYDMDVKGEKRIISNCIDMLVASYSSALQGKRSDLELPELMQLQVHSYE